LEEDAISDHNHIIISNANCVNAGATNMCMQEGTRIFCDASVGLQNSTPGRNQTGIILILTQPACSLSSASFFQVATPPVLELLEAEAHALLLGARLAVALNLQDATLHTDNQVVASTSQARSSRVQPGHWSLWPVLAEFEAITGTKLFSVNKNRREANKIAGTLAKRARHATIQDTCLFSCQALAHLPSCNVKDVLDHFEWGISSSPQYLYFICELMETVSQKKKKCFPPDCSVIYHECHGTARPGSLPVPCQTGPRLGISLVAVCKGKK